MKNVISAQSPARQRKHKIYIRWQTPFKDGHEMMVKLLLTSKQCNNMYVVVLSLP